MTVEYHHVPVLKEEVLAALAPEPSDIVVDCTLGGAGHGLALALKLDEQGTFLGIDQDEAALQAAQKQFQTAGLLGDDLLPLPNKPTICFIHGNFGELDRLLLEQNIPGINRILFDLGVSSFQFDEGSRGFSYRADAPLDMRMNPGKHTKTAQEVINTYNTADLTRILTMYADEKYAARIAKRIVEARAIAPINTTIELAELVRSCYPVDARAKKHPAKKTFQALRMEVNQEMAALEKGLDAAVRWLLPEGRIAAISYHSKEDRLVKHTFTEFSRGCICPPDLPQCVCHNVEIVDVITKHAIVPTDAEIEDNPRARSAKLRVAKKLYPPLRAEDKSAH